ncbi:MAG: hypothetical protein V1825_03960 [Candidatus Falkowbacteria bacterium]
MELIVFVIDIDHRQGVYKKNKTMEKNTQELIKPCKHDYKNAIQIGNIDYQCPLCGKHLDPNEWFFMNSFEFVDAKVQRETKIKKSKKV